MGNRRAKIILAAAVLVAFVAGATVAAFVKPGPNKDSAQEGVAAKLTSNQSFSKPVLVNCEEGKLAVARVDENGQIQVECLGAVGTTSNMALMPVTTEAGFVPAVERRIVPVRQTVVERRVVERARPTVRHKRSWQKSALIIAGSAGGGAAIGALAGGKKGAAIGAVSGGVAGLVYDLLTRNKSR
ncbi:MAG: hypothetical protein HY314_04290 [Acidobacteria bacterium]|nr:hypothetical protein [Acidobacteriota bacterium]